MTTLTPKEIASYAMGALGSNADPGTIQIAIEVALAESGGNTAARNVNTDKYRSVDLGLWQINAHWHPQYDTTKLLEPAYNAAAMAEISKGGTDWNAWSTYKSGKTKQFAGQADVYDPSISPADVPKIAGDAAGAAKDAVSNLLGGDWAGKLLGIAIASVFSLAALALFTIGLAQLGGADPKKVLDGAGTAAGAAALL